MTPRLLLAALAALAPGDDDAARRALDEAAELVRRGRFEDAVRRYAALAEEHPGTEAAAVAARRAAPNALLGWRPLAEAGPSENRLDLVLSGDGYELAHLDAFAGRATDAWRVLTRDEVVAEYEGYFDVWLAFVASAEGGIDAFGRSYDTAFDARDSGKTGHDVDLDRDRARALLSELPAWDGLALVLVRVGERGTGADGIGAVAERDVIAVRRVLGGALAGLADEIEEEQGVYTAPFAAPNISTTEDAARVPWAHWLAAGAPGVGVYPGGIGRVSGVWKPVASECAMNDSGDYCRVCREAMVLALHRFVDPVESADPPPQPSDAAPDGDLAADGRLELTVRAMTPAKHALEVAWYVLPEHGAPPAPAPRPGSAELPDRRARGPLAPIDVEPVRRGKVDKRGHAAFAPDTSRLAPGRYRVVCRVTDPTRVRGDKLPWVLADPDGLLQSERGWWIRVP